MARIQLGVSRKPKLGSDSVFKTKRSKNLTRFRRFSHRNCMQFAIQIKSDSNNFTRIQGADKDDTQCNCYSLLTTTTTYIIYSTIT